MAVWLARARLTKALVRYRLRMAYLHCRLWYVEVRYVGRVGWLSMRRARQHAAFLRTVARLERQYRQALAQIEAGRCSYNTLAEIACKAQKGR
jgi:hypothetical protein